jgi:hypothetical protein
MPRAKTKKAAPEEPAASEAGDDVVMNEPPESHQPSVEDTNDEEDASMADQPAEDEPVYEEEEDELRIRMVSFSHSSSLRPTSMVSGHPDFAVICLRISD